MITKNSSKLCWPTTCRTLQNASESPTTHRRELFTSMPFGDHGRNGSKNSFSQPIHNGSRSALVMAMPRLGQAWMRSATAARYLQRRIPLRLLLISPARCQPAVALPWWAVARHGEAGGICNAPGWCSCANQAKEAIIFSFENAASFVNRRDELGTIDRTFICGRNLQTCAEMEGRPQPALASAMTRWRSSDGASVCGCIKKHPSVRNSREAVISPGRFRGSGLAQGVCVKGEAKSKAGGIESGVIRERLRQVKSYDAVHQIRNAVRDRAAHAQERPSGPTPQSRHRNTRWAA